MLFPTKQRKEVLSELENRAGTLSKSLAESRDETASLKQEIASLREQNSFLRGMLSVQGIGPVDLPAVVPSSGTGQRLHQSPPRGASSAAAGASAIVGAVGTGLAVISCVALSAAGFGGGKTGFGNGSRVGYGYSGGGGGGRGGGPADGSSRGAGGRRMLLSVGDREGEIFSHPDGGDTTFLTFSNGGMGGYLVVGLAVALAFATVFVVARWAYQKEFARRRHVAVRRGRRGTVASRRGGNRKGGGFDFVGGVWPLDRLFGGDKPVRKVI